MYGRTKKCFRGGVGEMDLGGSKKLGRGRGRKINQLIKWRGFMIEIKKPFIHIKLNKYIFSRYLNVISPLLG